MTDTRGSKAVLAALAAAGRPLSTAELVAAGGSRATLGRMVEAGEVERAAHGVYRLPEYTSEHADWAALSVAVPQALFCLVSAAAFHRITQAMPAALDVAVPRAAGRARGGEAFPLRVNLAQWRSEEAFTEGVAVHVVDGVDVRVTTPERTVVDLFRFSDLNPSNANRDVRVTAETFLDCLHRALDPVDGAASADEVLRIAAVFRVERALEAHIQSLNFAVQRGYGA